MCIEQVVVPSSQAGLQTTTSRGYRMGKIYPNPNKGNMKLDYHLNKGEIGYVEYIQNLTQSVNIKTQYLQSLNELNQTIININYLTGK